MDMQPLIDFVESDLRNRWINVGPLSVYVRQAVHNCDGKARYCLDVASVESEIRGRGVFTEFLDYAEQLAADHGFDGVYVENVLNERLGPFLLRRGYQQIGPVELSSYFKACHAVTPTPIHPTACEASQAIQEAK